MRTLVWIGLAASLLVGCDKQKREVARDTPAREPGPTVVAVADAAIQAPAAPGEFTLLQPGVGTIALVPASFPAGGMLGDHEGRFTPTADDVAAAERTLAAEAMARNEKVIANGFARYRRQYVGFVAGGRRMVLGNFFCDDDVGDWTKQLVIVDDGGNCFFHFIYDLEAGKYTLFSVNGEA